MCVGGTSARPVVPGYAEENKAVNRNHLLETFHPNDWLVEGPLDLHSESPEMLTRFPAGPLGPRSNLAGLPQPVQR